jgi:hypothetical protein
MPNESLRHWTCYLNGYAQRVEVEAYDYATAQSIAAELLGTRRVRSICMIEKARPKHSAEDLLADTEEE